MADEVHRPTCPECGRLAAAVETSVVVETRAGSWREEVHAAADIAPSYSCENGHYFDEDGRPYGPPREVRVHHEPEGLRG